MYPAREEKPDILIEGVEGDDDEEEDYSRPYSEFEVGRVRGDVTFHKNAVRDTSKFFPQNEANPSQLLLRNCVLSDVDNGDDLRSNAHLNI
ncbi:hypothetical protein PoB_005748900 [Plakobranchus ocellatus]|uniref:Uncharacterized protein n=1 Tax=Plakobranchus ocellatus TaxID=259542 RepID=A0AAV4CIK4_9GAST|nr:hypothetical protein PoB_005748900 [Plakobranchus ocellatus]